jgi:hypothetical protein
MSTLAYVADIEVTHLTVSGHALRERLGAHRNH